MGGGGHDDLEADEEPHRWMLYEYASVAIGSCSRSSMDSSISSYWLGSGGEGCEIWQIVSTHGLFVNHSLSETRVFRKGRGQLLHSTPQSPRPDNAPNHDSLPSRALPIHKRNDLLLLLVHRRIHPSNTPRCQERGSRFDWRECHGGVRCLFSC